MTRLGPKIDGTSFVGETRSPMRWRWHSRSIGGGSCSIRDLSVAVTAEITLPRLSYADRAASSSGDCSRRSSPPFAITSRFS